MNLGHDEPPKPATKPARAAPKAREPEPPSNRPAESTRNVDDFFNAIAESTTQKMLDMVAQALSSADGISGDDYKDLREAWAARRDDIRRGKVQRDREPGEDDGVVA